MSQIEFDAYLARLLKSLRGRKGQSADLADELRDHLDARLEELLAQGKSRDEAIRLALEEFGEAGQLAQEFSRLAKSRRRRFVMRCTAASSVVVASVLLAALSLMPVVPEGPGAPPAVAQEEAAKPEAIASSNPGDESVEQKAIAALDQKLSQAVEVKFNGILLRGAVMNLAEQIKADVIFATQAIEEEGLTLDDMVSLELEHTPITARAALGFLLQPAGLAFANRSGVLFITTENAAEELLTIKVYNVRDLIARAAPSYVTPPSPFWGGMGMSGMGMGGMGGGGMMCGGGMGMMGGGGGFYSVQDQIAASLLAANAAQFGGMYNAGEAEGEMGMGMGMGGMGGTPSSMSESRSNSPAQNAMQALTGLIQQSTRGPWLMIEGTGGTIQAFDGLLVVRQTEQIHNEVQKLLDGLRAANQSGPGSSVTLPKGTAPPDQQTQSDSGRNPSALGDYDLSVLGQYDVTPDTRAALIGTRPLKSGQITQLEVLRAITLTPLPSLFGGVPTSMATNLIDPLGIKLETWQAAINRAHAHDKPLGELKTLLDRAQKLAGDQPIDAEHLFLALLEYKDGPVPAVLASVGLTPERLRKRILKPAQKASTDDRNRKAPEPEDNNWRQIDESEKSSSDWRSDWRYESQNPDIHRGRSPYEKAIETHKRSDENNHSSLDSSWSSLDEELFATARRSSVSIKVTKSENNTVFASGMIISSKDGKTLILTAWHPFRGLDGDSEIWVSVPTGGINPPPEKFTAKLIASNEEADLGLLRIGNEIDRPAAVIGAIDDCPEPGDLVACIASGTRGDKKLLPQMVESINPFSGPSTIACAGPLVTAGSSGAGLLTKNQRLVGICFAYDKDGSRNIYAGLASIHKLLKKAGYGDLIATSKEQADEKKTGNPFFEGEPVHKNRPNE